VGGRAGGYALFVGRLTEIKGVQILLDAWRGLSGRIPLKIVGDGALRAAVESAARARPEIEWLGQQPRERVQRLMREAYALIFPSVWYEPFPLVVLEALAAGLPVIASNLGSMASVIQHGHNGLHFAAGDAYALGTTVAGAWGQPEVAATMARNARRDYEANYTPEANYRMLVDIYARATSGRP
jgi:glycosyltransferase involved in cell wall biosynthesis